MKFPKIRAIDLFCGAGGLSCGLEQAGIDVSAGVDVDENCRYPYETNINASFHNVSVAKLAGRDLERIWDNAEVRLLAGCAPCQPFSSQRRGADTSHEKEWGLLGHFGRLLVQTEPDYVTMENVSGLKGQSVFKKFLKTLEDHNYFIDYAVLRAELYGLPQRRHRLVLVASRHGQIRLPAPTHTKQVSVADAIGKLTPLSDGQQDPNDQLHKARKFSDINLARRRASIPGGTWNDWPEKLRTNCQKKKSGRSFGSFYGVMDPDLPSPTITTQFFNYGSGRFGHPSQMRSITPREAAILQGFPPDYEFVAPGKPVYFSRVGKMIGNAVPPLFGKLVGEVFYADVKNRQKNQLAKLEN